MTDPLTMLLLSCILLLATNDLRRAADRRGHPNLSVLLTALWIAALAIWVVWAIRVVRGWL